MAEPIYIIDYTFKLSRTGDIELKHMSLYRNENTDPEPMGFEFESAATPSENKALIKTFIQNHPDFAYIMYVDWKKGDSMLQVKFMTDSDDIVFQVAPKKFYAFLSDLNRGGNTAMPTLINSEINTHLQDPSTWTYKRMKVGNVYTDVLKEAEPVTVEDILRRKAANTPLLYDMMFGNGQTRLPSPVKTQMLQTIAMKGLTAVNQTRAIRNKPHIPDETMRHIASYVAGGKRFIGTRTRRARK